MSEAVRRFQTAKGAIAFLESLAHESGHTFVFRGHTHQGYRLVNSWQRHCSGARASWNSDIAVALTAYRAGLQKLEIDVLEANRFDAMEQGRHFGLPIPCLDFSYSPYVALFFAFNGLRVMEDRHDWSVVLALDVDRLARAWASGRHDPERQGEAWEKAVRDFMWPRPTLFEDGFPNDSLQFIPFPGRHNKRMQRQLGCLLYDTLDYRERGLADLEDYLLRLQESGSDEAILTKVLISQKATPEIFSRLELMNITGGNLYDSAEGVAMDIRNAHHYNPKFSYLRDINIPYESGGKDGGGH